MARRSDDDDKKAVRKPDRGAQRDQEQKQEQEEEVSQEREPEHARLQNQYGNAALSAMMSSAGAPAGAGVEVEPTKRKREPDKEGEEFGGEDDPVDPVALDDLDLTESWNPGTTAPSDRTEFVDPMPDDTLPDEDAEWLAALRTVDVPRLPSATLQDALLQPSADVIAVSIRGWARSVAGWAGTAPHQRAWARLLTDSGPLMQDPHGRVLILRGRTGALASTCLLSAPVAQGLDINAAAFLDFQMELASRDWCVRAARLALGDEKRPSARALLATVLGEEGARVRPRRFDDTAMGALEATIHTLLALEDPRALVPRLAEPEAAGEDPDDPLGLDAILAEKTGGGTDPHETMYRAALQTAERLAAAINQTRVRAAGTAVALAEVALLWSAGAPVHTLLAAMNTLDGETANLMQQLREIARAAQRQAVPLPRLAEALTRTADDLATTQRQLEGYLAAVGCGILPGAPRLPAPEPIPEDPLEAAWADGVPREALPWLRSLPASIERDAAIAFTRMSVEADPRENAEGLLALRGAALAAGNPFLAGAAGVCAGPCLLLDGRTDEALALSAEQVATGLSRRNGIWLADGALLGMEAHVARGAGDRAEALRLIAGAKLWRMGAQGALTLLARWRPAEPE